MTFEEWVDENIKYIRTPDIFQWLFEAWEAGAKAEREKQAEQEPVAWMVYTEDGQSVYITDNPADIKDGQRALPLYTESVR